MSAATTTPAQLELINSLTQDEIPIKLRCAICSRLAVNAFRLPCCDQAICESCQSTLPSTCPVCEHTPVSAEDCKPNKSLRTTIKVFLRTEEKKREALRIKEAKISPPATPLEPEPKPVEVPAPSETPVVEAVQETPVPEVKNEETPAVEIPQEIPADHAEAENTEAQQDIPQQSIEEIEPGQESTEDGDANKAEGATTEDGDKEATEGDKTAADATQAGFGNFNPTAAGGFPAMGFGGDMNQMQMMMAMQNGIGAGGFGNFPMMGMPGMPGMGMDPMTMQNMFMNGGFGAGMGMNGMNMGMGMGGFDGGMGAGFNNAWNGQQMNMAPDNFNHPNGYGDYGNNNSGYASHSAGFQGNYGRANHHNDYNSYGSQGFRGRGRGRGGYGRGGYGYGSNDPSQQFPQQFGSGHQANGPISETGSIPTGPKADAAEADSNVDEFGREIRPKSETKDEAKPNETTTEGQNGENVETTGDESNNPTDTLQQADPNAAEPGNGPMPIQTLDEVEPSYQGYGHNAGYNAVNGYGANRGGYGFRGGRGGFGAMPPPVKPVDVPINAPTGPKAMREGLPNTTLRGRGFAAAGRPSSRAGNSASARPHPKMTRRLSVEENVAVNDVAGERRRAVIVQKKLPKILLEMRKQIVWMLTDQDRLHLQNPNDQVIEVVEKRTSTVSESVRLTKTTNLLHTSIVLAIDLAAMTDPEVEIENEIAIENPSRRPSLVSNGINGIEIKGASTRNKSIVEEIKIPTGPRQDRTSNRDREKDRSSSNRHHRREESSSHRTSHYHEPGRSSGRDKDRERERPKEKEKDKSKSSTAPPVQDPHTLEREKRNRERLLKEAQRIAGLTAGMSGKKRGRDDEETGRKGRKKGRRSGAIAGDDEEARISRLEAERESARWG
ncbi:hypothetical protein B0J14DRAFT_547380 [Halenospora varia]|nr:hypothetical protein B0J14DRAFT_547380 [Halenospora varia]